MSEFQAERIFFQKKQKKFYFFLQQQKLFIHLQPQ